ncbi:hypothetical protein ACP70R_035871 [Stipagrostis hirtigluma subsp. patula]
MGGRRRAALATASRGRAAAGRPVVSPSLSLDLSPDLSLSDFPLSRAAASPSDLRRRGAGRRAGGRRVEAPAGDGCGEGSWRAVRFLLPPSPSTSSAPSSPSSPTTSASRRSSAAAVVKQQQQGRFRAVAGRREVGPTWGHDALAELLGASTFGGRHGLLFDSVGRRGGRCSVPFL